MEIEQQDFIQPLETPTRQVNAASATQKFLLTLLHTSMDKQTQ